MRYIITTPTTTPVSRAEALDLLDLDAEWF
jgi:hypothetical protein